MRTEAQKRADAKYKSESTARLFVELNKNTDADIIARLAEMPSKAGYIKQLIRQDMVAK